MTRKRYAPEHLIPYITMMYNELRAQPRIVLKVMNYDKGAHYGKYVWVVQQQNPDWYRKLIRKYPRRRILPKKWNLTRLHRVDSKIKRGDIERTLWRLSHKLWSRSKYTPDILCIAQKYYKEDRKIFASSIEEFLWYAHHFVPSDEDCNCLRKLFPHDREIDNAVIDFLDAYVRAQKSHDVLFLQRTLKEIQDIPF